MCSARAIRRLLLLSRDFIEGGRCAELAKVTGGNNIPEEAEIGWIVSCESCNPCYLAPTGPTKCASTLWRAKLANWVVLTVEEEFEPVFHFRQCRYNDRPQNSAAHKLAVADKHMDRSPCRATSYGLYIHCRCQRELTVIVTVIL